MSLTNLPDDFLVRFNEKVNELNDCAVVMGHLICFIDSKDLTDEFEEYLEKNWIG